MFKKDKPVYKRLTDIRPKSKKTPNKKLVGASVGVVTVLLGLSAFKNRGQK
jgi:hypothetical protein